ncbi:MAG: hypothetical protein JNM37_07660 [Rhodocyclaceae bacterium]|nr:hypothetical protein [Rhodocyclaceae bacterium]
MKIAVIVVGSHFTGKSRVINAYLKPLLGLSLRQRLFHRKGKSGCILSQSLEESRSEGKDKIQRHAHFDLLVLAARPDTESPSQLLATEKLLTKHGFKRFRVVMDGDPQSEPYCKRKAKEILKHLDA